MQVDDNTVTSFHYVLRDSDGAQIDSSHDRDEPLVAMIGHGHLVAGVETGLKGHVAGDRFNVIVQPADGYGERREGLTQRVGKKYFRDVETIKPGSTATLAVQGGGQRSVTVLKVGSSVIDVDLNHPLAGKTLEFSIEVIDVRAATSEEIKHGHVHGPHGHEH